MSYEVETSIDKDNLDLEWVKQADLFQKYSKYANKAYNTHVLLKNYFNVLKAEVELNVRSGKIDIGCKLTEGAISSYLETSPKLQKANKDVLDAKYELDMYSSAVQAMEHKKRALEYLTKLFLSNYYDDSDAYVNYREKMKEKMQN